MPGRVDSGSSTASTRFSSTRRCNIGDSVPDGTPPARVPASDAMWAWVLVSPPTASRTRLDASGIGNSASKAASGTPNIGDAGSSHSAAMNSSALTPLGHARKIPGRPPVTR